MTERDIGEVNYMSCCQSVNQRWWIVTCASSARLHRLSRSDGCRSLRFWPPLFLCVLAAALLATETSLARLLLPPLILFFFYSLSLCFPPSHPFFLGVFSFSAPPLLSVLLLVCQMMYSRCSSSMAIVGPWRILKHPHSLSPSQAHEPGCLQALSLGVQYWI